MTPGRIHTRSHDITEFNFRSLCTDSLNLTLHMKVDNNLMESCPIQLLRTVQCIARVSGNKRA